MTSTSKLGTALVSQQLCELPHSPACSSLLRSACGNVSLNLATFLARAILELWRVINNVRFDLSHKSLTFTRPPLPLLSTEVMEAITSAAEKRAAASKFDEQIVEDKLDVGIYQRMGAVYGEHCLVRTIGTNVFVKGGKRYHISMTMPVKTCPLKSRQPLKNSFEKC
ncbi:hypothetical protein TNCV_3033191 [Trichonephila clavipes]|nr:hypothetical protein TNCV_3033191 [Trichonephila clavipes]